MTAEAVAKALGGRKAAAVWMARCPAYDDRAPSLADQDEVLFDATRPVILNGIEDTVTRPDRADRAVFLTLEPISEERRRPEQELWAAFEAERPRLLGALLEAVAKGMAMLPQIKLDTLFTWDSRTVSEASSAAAVWRALDEYRQGAAAD